MKDMKTKEEILKECQLSQPYQEGTWYKGAIEAMRLYSDQQNKEKDAEIQRLREGVEELKNDLLDALDLKNGNGPTALTMLSNEITRLRELLGETLKWLQWSSHSDAQLLASKIDNALNHKP